MKPASVLAWLGFALGSLTLYGQFELTLSASIASGRGWPLGIAHYLGFLTILSNLGLVLIYASEIFPGLGLLGPLRDPRARGAAAAIITLVMIFYFVFLAPINPATGMVLFNDYIFHLVLPLLYIVWWGLGVAHGRLAFTDVPVMVAPALVYAAYVLVRGPILGEYPYPMIDVSAHGYPYVLVFMGGVAVGLVALSALYVLADRLLRPPGAPAGA